MTGDTTSLGAYAVSAVLFTAAFLLFVAVIGPWFGRELDRFIARKNREADEAIADPVLAAHRGQSTRLVRGHTVPRQLTEGNTR
jgi:hypothetical protein